MWPRLGPVPQLFPSISFILKLIFYLFYFFKYEPYLKSFIEFVTILLLFHVLVFWPQGMRDLSPLTKDQTHTPCIRRWSLNHWTIREVPGPYSMARHAHLMGQISLLSSSLYPYYLLQFMLPSSIWMSSQESVAYSQSPKSDNCISKTVLDLFSFCFFLFVYWFRCSLSFI